MQSSDPFYSTVRRAVGTIMRHGMRGFRTYARETGLSYAQLGALMSIYRHGSGVSDIGEELDITSVGASQMLERLVQQDLVERNEDPHDRRVKQIVLTDKGRDVVQEVFRARQGWLDDLNRSLSPAEKEQVTAALNVLIEKVDQLEERSWQHR